MTNLDVTAGEIVDIIRGELGIDAKSPLRLPYFAGLAAGYAFDVLAWTTKRPLPISSIRIKKFCADTAVAAQRLQTIDGFRPQCSLPDALRRMVRYEFIEGGSKEGQVTEGGG